MPNDTESIHQRVTDQFSPTAATYATSGVHANAVELTQLAALVEPKPTDEAIDVATGAGHMALALAPFVARVTAFDLTQSMLDQTLETARERGFDNVLAVQGPAEQLPFPDESFDIYTVRLAPHHFADIQATVDGAARVLRSGGRYLVVDTVSPSDPDLDAALHEIEILRDPSHVRNYTVAEWTSMLASAELEVKSAVEGYCGDLEFHDWTRRQNVPADRKQTLHNLFAGADSALRELLRVREAADTFYFQLPQVTLLATKA